MPRQQIAAIASLGFSLYWAVMALLRWPSGATPDTPPPTMQVFLCVLFAALAVTLWRGRPGGR
jgi:hypothetical protein